MIRPVFVNNPLAPQTAVTFVAASGEVSIGQMQSSLKTPRMIAVLIRVGFCLLLVTTSLAQDRDLVELMQSDLFGLPNWRSKTVAVDGFVRGMTRAHALEIAEAKQLRLVPRGALTIAQMKGPCVQASCDVYKAQGSWVGITLFFEAEKINKLGVGLSVDMDPEVKKANIAGNFKGLTHQFFNDYSDRLRNQIFGSADARRDSSKPQDTEHLKYVRYEYPESGVVVHATMNEKEPVDLEVDFVAPQ